MILDRLKVVIDADTSGLKAGINDAKKATLNLSNATNKAAREINTSFDNIDISTLFRIQSDLIKNELGLHKANIHAIQAAIQDVESEIDNYTAKLREALNELSKVPANIGHDRALYAVPAMEVLKYTDLIAESTSKITELEAAQRLETNTINQLTEALARLKEEQKAYNKEVAQSTLSTKGGLLGKRSLADILKGILLYRVLRGIISTITAEIKEGIQYLAVYDKKMGGIAGYNKTMSLLASNWKKMTTTFSVTAMSLLTSIAPILNSLMTATSWLFERISELVAALQGKKTYTAANPEYWQDYAEYVEESNSKLKETKKLISGFDELNTLDSKTSLFNTDNSLTVEKEVTAVGALAGLWPLLIPIIKKLIDLFKGKNKALTELTADTEAETAAASSLASVFAKVAVAAAAVTAAIASIPAVKQTVIEVVTTGIQVAWEILANIKTKVLEIAQSVSTELTQAFNVAAATISATALVISNALTTTAQNTINAVQQMSQSISNTILTVCTNAVSNILVTASNIANNISTLMTNIVQTVQSKLDVMKTAFLTFALLTLNLILTWGLTIKLNINTTFQAALTNILSFTTSAINKLNTFITTSKSSMSLWSSGILSTVSTWGTTFVTKISSALNSAMSKISTWCSNALSKIQTVFNKMNSASSYSSSSNAKSTYSFSDVSANSSSLTQSRYNSTSNKTTGTTSAATVSYTETPANNRRATGNSLVTQKTLSATSTLTSSLLSKLKAAGAWCEKHPALLAALGISALAGLLVAGTAAAAVASSTAAKTSGAAEAIAAAEAIVDKVAASSAVTLGTTAAQNTANWAEINSWLDALEEISVFAKGGVVTSPTLAMVGEYAGASSNPEIVTPQNILKETIDSSNNMLADIITQCTRQVITSLENMDMSVSIGDDVIAKSAARGNNNYRMMTGVSLIS